MPIGVLRSIERGETPANVEMIYRIAEALGVAPGELLPAPPTASAACDDQVAEFLASSAGLEIADIASQLSDLSRTRLLTLVEVMLDQERRAAA